MTSTAGRADPAARSGAPVTGVLLAAGRGLRFGGGKLLARLAGGELVGVAACRQLVAVIPAVIAVVRPGDDELAAALAGAGARVVSCPEADAGMGASLACGVRAAIAARGWIVALADMPWIRVETIAAVAAAVGAGATLAAPFHGGVRGHPVGFGAACGPALAALADDFGARSLVAAHAGALLRIDVDDPGVLRDVDTPRDLA